MRSQQDEGEGCPLTSRCMPHHACGDQGMCLEAGFFLFRFPTCPAPQLVFCDFIIHFSDSFACHPALAPKGGGKGNGLSSLLRSQFQCLVQVFMVPPSALLTSPYCPCYLGTPHGLVMLKDWAVRCTLLTDADGHLLVANCLLNHKLTF